MRRSDRALAVEKVSIGSGNVQHDWQTPENCMKGIWIEMRFRTRDIALDHNANHNTDKHRTHLTLLGVH